MKNNNISSSSSSGVAGLNIGNNSSNISGGGGRRFFSSWASPQNPLITLLRRKRDSKTKETQGDKQSTASSLVTSKASVETRQQNKQRNAHNPAVQTTVRIVSSSSSSTSTPRKANGPSHQNVNDLSLKRSSNNGFKPKKIEEYEPGQSSIALKENILEPAEYNPPICKPGELCRYSESKESKNFRIRKKNETSKSHRLGFPPEVLNIAQTNGSPGNSSNSDTLVEGTRGYREGDKRSVYREVQKGGTIPEEGLWNLVEQRKVKTLPAPSSESVGAAASVMPKSSSGLPNGTADLRRRFEEEKEKMMGKRKTRQEVEDEMKTRRMTMEKIIAMEKLKKLEAERKSNEARRHNDNFLPVQKSPVKLNRYEDEIDEGRSRTSNPRKAKFTAVALYSFKAKSERELGLRRGDVVRVLRQVDRNWFEGERNGQVGIFPITYVKITLPQTKKEPTLKGRVLYDFNASAPPELSLYRGEKVTIVGVMDDNWVDGRSRNGEGIFPVNCVKILDDEDDDSDTSRSSSSFGTPLQSRTATPSFDQRNAHLRLSLRERGKEEFRVVSPVGSVTSSYAPTVPSAPLSPFGSQDLDTTTGSYAISDWPSLEASLLDLEKVSISQLMQQQQQALTDRPLERAVSLPQKYRPQQYGQGRQIESQTKREQQLRQEMLQLQREASEQKSLLRHNKLDRFQERSAHSRDSPRRDFLSQSAHPDLCVGNVLNNSPPMRAVPRSATNSGLPDRSGRTYNNQSSPYNRYPSLISKDPVVAVDSEFVVKEMMAKQSEAVTKEFLSRHGSRASVATETSTLERTPLMRQSLPAPVSRDASRLATIQRSATGRLTALSAAGYNSGGGTLSRRARNREEEEEVFQFKEIKLKPRLPTDYSRPTYTIETRASLPGGRSSIQPSPAPEARSPPAYLTLRQREVSPMKSYEWHKVLYDYQPNRLDEISLKRGDLVQVVEKCGDGWWLGISQTTGKFGLFPGNYVTPT